jgi:hypothetical protein
MSELKNVIEAVTQCGSEDDVLVNGVCLKEEDWCFFAGEHLKSLTAELARTKEMLAVAEAGLKEVAAPISFGCYTERYRKARFYAKQALAKINKMKEV